MLVDVHVPVVDKGSAGLKFVTLVGFAFNDRNLITDIAAAVVFKNTCCKCMTFSTFCSSCLGSFSTRVFETESTLPAAGLNCDDKKSIL